MQQVSKRNVHKTCDRNFCTGYPAAGREKGSFRTDVPRGKGRVVALRASRSLDRSYTVHVVATVNNVDQENVICGYYVR